MAEEKAKELVSSEGAHYPLNFFDIDKWFEQSLLRPFAPFGLSRLRAVADEVSPAVDLFEDGDDLVLKAELPGLKKDDIDITLNDGSITLAGEKKNEHEIKRKDYYKWESTYGSFCRTFALPTEVQTDKVKSTRMVSSRSGCPRAKRPKAKRSRSRSSKRGSIGETGHWERLGLWEDAKTRHFLAIFAAPTLRDEAGRKIFRQYPAIAGCSRISPGRIRRGREVLTSCFHLQTDGDQG